MLLEMTFPPIYSQSLTLSLLFDKLSCAHSNPVLGAVRCSKLSTKTSSWTHEQHARFAQLQCRGLELLHVRVTVVELATYQCGAWRATVELLRRWVGEGCAYEWQANMPHMLATQTQVWVWKGVSGLGGQWCICCWV